MENHVQVLREEASNGRDFLRKSYGDVVDEILGGSDESVKSYFDRARSSACKKIFSTLDLKERDRPGNFLLLGSGSVDSFFTQPHSDWAKIWIEHIKKSGKLSAEKGQVADLFIFDATMRLAAFLMEGEVKGGRAAIREFIESRAHLANPANKGRSFLKIIKEAIAPLSDSPIAIALQEYQEDFEFISILEKEGFRVFKWTKPGATDGSVLLLNSKWGAAEDKSKEIHECMVKVAGATVKRWRAESLAEGNKKIVCVRSSLQLQGRSFPVWITSAHGDSSFADAEFIMQCADDLCGKDSYFLRYSMSTV
jgi:hypothetical protein